jgi:hypothetical protein
LLYLKQGSALPKRQKRRHFWGLFINKQKIADDSYFIRKTDIFYKKATVPLVKKYSTLPEYSSKLNPHWVTGFSDGEACFSIEISEVKDNNIGWKIAPIFSIGLHSKDLALIKEIQSFFNGVGKVYLQEKSKVVVLRIKSIKDLAQYVIPLTPTTLSLSLSRERESLRP